MRLALALAVALFVSPVLSASHGGVIISPTSAYAKLAKPGADIPALCRQIVADQTRSKQAMADAANLYFHGMLMGQACVPVDYVKSLTLMQASGHAAEYAILARVLKERAASGNALAVSAVEKLHL